MTPTLWFLNLTSHTLTWSTVQQQTTHHNLSIYQIRAPTHWRSRHYTTHEYKTSLYNPVHSFWKSLGLDFRPTATVPITINVSKVVVITSAEQLSSEIQKNKVVVIDCELPALPSFLLHLSVSYNYQSAPSSWSAFSRNSLNPSKTFDMES